MILSPCTKTGVYRVSYEISSTTDRYVEAMIQQNGGTYQAYTWKGHDLTAEPQTVDYEFTMKQDSDVMSKLVFNCGLENEEDLPAHTIYLDNVKVELVDDSKVELYFCSALCSVDHDRSGRLSAGRNQDSCVPQRDQ